MSDTENENQKFVDRITMELLLNKTHYAKFLAKSDEQRHAEYQELLCRLQSEATYIVKTTETLLRNPKHPGFSEDVLHSFQQYAEAVMRYHEVQDLQQPEEEEEAEEEEEEGDLKRKAKTNFHTTLDGFVRSNREPSV
jgi:hypothetical protein